MVVNIMFATFLILLIAKSEMEIITLNKFMALANGSDIIYSPIYYVHRDNTVGIQPKFIPPNHPYKLITHGGDDSITKEHLYILNDTNLIEWYGINTLYSHPKLHPIPIGVKFLGDTNEWQFTKVINMSVKKTKILYTNFSLYAWLEERKLCNEAINKLGYKNISDTIASIAPAVNYRDYLLDLASHRFCVCPIGNGIDTFRLWECLYMKCIPIMVKKINGTSIDYFQCYKNLCRDLPILWIDTWDDLKPNDLTPDKYNEIIADGDIKKLDFYYWKLKIIEPLRH